MEMRESRTRGWTYPEAGFTQFLSVAVSNPPFQESGLAGPFINCGNLEKKELPCLLPPPTREKAPCDFKESLLKPPAENRSRLSLMAK